MVGVFSSFGRVGAKPVGRSTLARVVALAGVGALAACGQGAESPRGFSLPAGDFDAGRAVFVDYRCASCHAVTGDPSLRQGIEPEMTVALGGPRTRVTTYAELVSSVINPSHRIAQGYASDTVTVDGASRMPAYNQVMTVAELTDLVTYLQAQYTVPPVYPDYPEYIYP